MDGARIRHGQERSSFDRIMPPSTMDLKPCSLLHRPPRCLTPARASGRALVGVRTHHRQRSGQTRPVSPVVTQTRERCLCSLLPHLPRVPERRGRSKTIRHFRRHYSRPRLTSQPLRSQAGPRRQQQILTPTRKTDDDAFTDEPTVLPSFTPACAPSIRWGNLDGDDFCDAITAAYHEAVHWQRNIFLTPSGAEGKEFIQEMARLFQAYAEGSAMESFALTAAMTMPLLLLQKPHRSSKTKGPRKLA